MIEKGLVSIIVPTHNRANMLSRALGSILGQTYENWETIVIANDCHDNTAEIMERYLSDKRFSFVNIPDAIGGAEARNVGLRKSKGEYIAFLDDDDEWLPKKTELQIGALDQRHDVAVVSSNYINIYGDYSKIGKLPEFVKLDDLLYQNLLGSFSFCLTKAVFAEGIEIDKKLHACQDWSFWCDILCQTNMKGYVVQEPLVKYSNYNDPSRLSLNKRNKYYSYVSFLEKRWNLMNKEQKAYNMATLYAQRNLLSEGGKFTKLRLSLKTIRQIYLSKKLLSVRKIIGLAILPFFNIDAGNMNRILYRH